eukprot:TRINITY_DN4004_c0_g1_i1.p1 TRINITY_DN4004_c0_g1~~TRINITY_DN4004_c0_g1_i1.p1  ORF type:complete len:279 (-),score=39.90 TRINITY_DN4004_c0_g1_i1:21-857(-)
MEFPELGKHCSVPLCKRLDFCPFTCAGCDKIFCLEHRTFASHHCEKRLIEDRKAIVCPVCERPLSVPPSVDPNNFIDDHINSGCSLSATSSVVDGKVKAPPRYVCSVKGCKKVEQIPILCKKCRKHYCVSHRFESDHNCQKQIEQKISAPSIPTPQPKLPEKIHTHTTIRVRTPNGTILQQSFDVNAPFSEVINFIESNRDNSVAYTLYTTYPRHEFTPQDLDRTLVQLRLVPSGMLILNENNSDNNLDVNNSNSEGGWYGYLASFVNSWNPFSSSQK